MWLEDYTPEIESSEDGWNSAESAKASAEKFKEQAKKAWKHVKKTRKDEKKAKKYDFLLAGFLVKIIVDKKYDFILDSLFPTIHAWYPSNFILWILSLINIEISNKIREISGKKQINFLYKTEKEPREFDDAHIRPEIKDRINYWIEDIIDSVVIEYSNIQTDKLKTLLESDNKQLLTYTQKVFSFFLKEININITPEKSENISKFILSEVKKSVGNLNIEKI